MIGYTLHDATNNISYKALKRSKMSEYMSNWRGEKKIQRNRSSYMKMYRLLLKQKVQTDSQCMPPFNLNQSSTAKIENVNKDICKMNKEFLKDILVIVVQPYSSN